MTDTGESAVRTQPPHIIVLASEKGGVGKTTLAVELASVIADSSGRCLLVDVDQQRTAEEIVAAAGEALPFDFAVESDPRVLLELKNVRQYDSIIVDTAGSLQASAFLVEILASADFVLIPMIPERASVTPTVRTAQLCVQQGVPFRVVLNQVDPLRGAGPTESAWALLDEMGLPRTRSFVRRYVAHSQAQLDGIPITAYRGDRSWRSALDDVRRLHAEILIGLGRLSPSPALKVS